MALIGADGIWSAVRNHLFPEVQPQFSGLIAWRGTLDATTLPREYTSPRVQLWMGPDAHLVAYPISAARQINVVAIVPGTWNRPGWSAPGDANELKNAFASQRWPATGADAARRRRRLAANGRCSRCPMSANGRTARSRCSATPRTRCCRLPRKAPAWRSRMPPCSPKCLSESPGDTVAGIPATLKRYGRLRRGRVLRVQRAARRNGTHLSSHRTAGAGARPRSSRRWAHSACWRGRTGFMIGGCERGFVAGGAISPSAGDTVPGFRFAPSGLRSFNLPRGWPSNAALGAGAGAIDGGTGAGLASGFASWHLFFCQASSASFDCPRTAM